MGIDSAVLCEDQPIGGAGAATLMHESKWLTEFIRPDSLEVQTEHDRLIQGLGSNWDKALALFNRVLDIPYTVAVKVRVSVDGHTFVQNDAWLEPGQALKAGTSLNCANRALLLASLLRCDYSAAKVWAVFGNLKIDGLGGHAWVMLREGQDYILETTSPRIRSPIIHSSIHEPVIFFNDKEVRAIPNAQLLQPFSLCYGCLDILKDYLDKNLCTV